MKEQLENIHKNYEQLSHKQFVNFKQLLKFKSLKNDRKMDHERAKKSNNALKDIICNKSLNGADFSGSHFRLPVEARSFEEINQKQGSQYVLARNRNEVVFPLIKADQQNNASDYLNVGMNRSNKLSNRGDFFHRIREGGIEKLKSAASKKNKRKLKYFKTRESELSLPSKLNCRSISPLSNYDNSSERKLLATGEISYQKLNCRISSSLEKVSSRYKDIPLSEFMYDRKAESSQLTEKDMQSKMERIWRKKSKGTKEVTSHT